MQIKLLLTVLFFSTVSLYSQNNTESNILFESANAQSSINDINLTSNPAIGFNYKDNFVKFAYIPSKFGMDELGFISLSSQRLVNENQVVGFFISKLNNDKYFQMTNFLSYGISIEDNFSFGLSLVYQSQEVKNYNKNSSLFANIGAKLKISDLVQAGFVYNNFMGNLLTSDSLSNSSASIGISLNPEKNLFLDFDLLLHKENIAGINMGIKYMLIDILALGTYYNSAKKSIEFASSCQINKSLKVYYLYSIHQYLGDSQEIGISLYY